MAAQLVYRRLKASTLVEVLVALVIITLVMAIAATLYAKMALKRPDNLVGLQLQMKAIAAETKHSKYGHAERYTLDNGVTIDKEILPYQNDTLLNVLELRAHKQGTGEVAVYREILIDSQ
ncbi:type II secretion system protein [Parapedobacter sp. ISTM3]|uniref:type II secretion system protein n=1 Tax=Parapedobacter sp. ISTM3 TaxID=2800130 RepID=UPI0019069331|nr:type II secretion system protein [Parapedobacter sp. ISTM3]MBK1442018.1 type II secretion system protein [Parapedobacter sp. ISTM3]